MFVHCRVGVFLYYVLIKCSMPKLHVVIKLFVIIFVMYSGKTKHPLACCSQSHAVSSLRSKTDGLVVMGTASPAAIRCTGLPTVCLSSALPPPAQTACAFKQFSTYCNERYRHMTPKRSTHPAYSLLISDVTKSIQATDYVRKCNSDPAADRTHGAQTGQY